MTDSESRVNDGVRLQSDDTKTRAISKMDVGKIHEPSLLHPTVVCGIVHGEYLETQDLGRFLLLTNPKIGDALCIESSQLYDPNAETKQDVWKALCTCHWGRKHMESIIDLTKLSPYECFRSFIHPKSSKYTPSSLKYSPSDYILYVEVRQLHSKELLFLETIRGNDISDFFSDGYLSVAFEGGPVAKKYVPFGSGHNAVRVIDFSANVRLLRLHDRKTLDLFCSDKVVYFSDQDYDWVDDTTVRLQRSYPKEKHYYPLNGVNDLLKTRFSSQNFMVVKFELDERFVIYPTERSLALFEHFDFNFRVPGCRKTPEGERGIFGFDLDVGLKNSSDADTFSDLNRVLPDDLQFAHVLEDIQGWKHT